MKRAKKDRDEMVELIEPLGRFKFRERRRRSSFEQSPLNELEMAITDHDVESLKEIMSKPDFDQLVNEDDRSPLLLAVKHGELEVAAEILKHGGFIDSLYNKESPVYLAAFYGDTGLLQQMTRSGKRKHVKDVFQDETLYGKGHTLFYPAIKGGYPEVIDYIIRERDDFSELLKKELGNVNDLPALLNDVVKYKMINLLEHLLRIDIKLLSFQSQSANNITLLMRAIEHENADIVSLLLSQELGKESIGLRDSFGRNVLHYSVKSQQILKLILNVTSASQSVEIEKIVLKTDMFNCHPTHYAAVEGFTESLQVLAHHCALAIDGHWLSEGYYVLSCLSCEHCIDSVKLGSVKSAWDCLEASQKGHQLLRQITLNAAARKGRIDIIKFLLQLGVRYDVISANECGTPFHIAVVSGSLATVKIMVERSPDIIHLKDENGRTAAWLAAYHNRILILEYLFKHGVRVVGEYLDDNLFKAAEEGKQDNHDIYKLMIDRVKDDKIEDHGDFDRKEEKKAESFPVKYWIRHFPSVVTYLFNTYVETKGTQKIYKFYPLIGNRKPEYYAEIVQAMVDKKRDEILLHPLVNSFLNTRLNSQRLFNINHALSYIIYVISFTTYIGLYCDGKHTVSSSQMRGLAGFTLFSCANLMYVLLTKLFYRRLRIRFLRIFNALQWIAYICTFIFLLPLNEDKNGGRIQAGAVGIFLAWVNFIWTLRSVPYLNLYVILVRKVFISMAKTLPVVVLYLFAFGTTLLLLRKDYEGFGSFSSSAYTMIAMMNGDINYGDNFFENNSAMYAMQSFFILLFVLMVCIAIMNLLIGLAVGDTEQIIKRSKAKCQLYKVMAILESEKRLQYRRSYYVQHMKISEDTDKPGCLVSIYNIITCFFIDQDGSNDD